FLACEIENWDLIGKHDKLARLFECFLCRPRAWCLSGHNFLEYVVEHFASQTLANQQHSNVTALTGFGKCGLDDRLNGFSSVHTMRTGIVDRIRETRIHDSRLEAVIQSSARVWIVRFPAARFLDDVPCGRVTVKAELLPLRAHPASRSRAGGP